MPRFCSVWLAVEVLPEPKPGSLYPLLFPCRLCNWIQPQKVPDHFSNLHEIGGGKVAAPHTAAPELPTVDYQITIMIEGSSYEAPY